jgi:hypothetical protein
MGNVEIRIKARLIADDKASEYPNFDSSESALKNIFDDLEDSTTGDIIFDNRKQPFFSYIIN